MEDEARRQALRVMFLILGAEAPSSRYRVLQYLPYLREEGIEPVVHELEGGETGRWVAIWRARRFPVVFVQKKLLTLPQWLGMRSGSPKLVFDFDDAIIYRDSAKGAGLSLGRLRRFRRIVRSCDLVIAGNSYLRGLAQEDARRLLTIPTPIDLRRYTQRGHGRRETLKIGWIGSRGTLFYLERLEGVLRDVCRRTAGVKVKVVSDAFPSWEGIPLECKHWSYEEEITDLHSFDIGIMPLTDDPWSRGKCGFKLLQYMAVGLPVVCSPVGVNGEIVRDGENGLLARGPEQWASCLHRLLRDGQMRSRLGESARKTVKEGYALEEWAGRMARALWEISGIPR
jgi:glycosyltransferase involved in cell wall biosynthesis